MKTYTKVSRKTVGEDRVAICPNFGCEFISRVKPLKFGFLGFGKYPKCRKHRIPLVYINERISDFVDATLACLFDKSGLPPSELHENIKSKFPDEYNSYIDGWVYCITVGRGAPIVSHYMDTISNAYLKQLTKKQIKALKNKIVIIDIETTGFNRDLDSIIEIGIVELDIKSGQIRTLFNSQVKDTNFDVSQHIDNTFIKTSGIDIYEISESISIKECEEDLQLIFDNYRCAAYNRTFDFGWLESRTFSIPMKLMDIMRFCIKLFSNCKSFKFQDVYRFITDQLNDFITKYLTRTYYKSNHRAIDDAICEAEVLFYLIKELGFPLTYQSKL